MATRASFNKNNSAIKRIMQEARELANDPCTDYVAAPLEDNLFEWHCTIRGPPETDFEGGLYHFRIILPSEYPFRPPSIMMLTPSGRFETNTQICISFTSYHEELWQPAWGVRTAIIGLQGFFPMKGQAAVGVGSVEAPPFERKRLAKLSREWICPHCKVSNLQCLPDPQPSASSSASNLPPEDIQGSSNLPSAASELQPNTSANTPIPTCAPEPESHERTSSLSVNSPPSATPVEANSPQPLVPDPTQTTRLTTSSVGGTRQQSESRAAVHIPSTLHPTSITRSPRSSQSRRPPVMLDAAISVLFMLVAALLVRKVF